MVASSSTPTSSSAPSGHKQLRERIVCLPAATAADEPGRPSRHCCRQRRRTTSIRSLACSHASAYRQRLAEQRNPRPYAMEPRHLTASPCRLHLCRGWTRSFLACRVARRSPSVRGRRAILRSTGEPVLHKVQRRLALGHASTRVVARSHGFVASPPLADGGPFPR